MSTINPTWVHGIDKAIAKLAQYWRRDSGCAADLAEIKAYLEAQHAARVAAQEPSPTRGMNLGERIAHVGGRTNAAGYIEFGSPTAIDALIQHVLRDTAAQPETWKVLPSPARVTGEMLHATYPCFNGGPWDASRNQAVWNDWAEQLNARLAIGQRV